jgi:tripartite motif-containing protein 71
LWNPNATTFADNNTIGLYPYGVFVNINNTVYVADRADSRILIWLEESINFTKIISGGLNYPYSVFVTIAGDIYVDNGYLNGRVDKWTSNATNSTPVMYVNASCFGLFVDVYDNLYCSMHATHQVMMKSPGSSANTSTIVAGTGCAGSASNMLNSPWGIFVDISLNLYVADYSNNRIQFFVAEQPSGTTVAGNGVSISLHYPTGITLDADGYLFIVDRIDNRIIGSGPNGFRCLVGCSGSGSASDQLSFPQTLSFDSYGNMFVIDTENNRIQKFLLATNSCGECDFL